HLAGVKMPEGIDGRPFLGKGIDASTSQSRNTALGYADRFDEKYDLVRTLRKGKFEYVRNYQPFNIDGLQNNYRYIMLAYREWREMFQAGKLNAAQSQFFRARPAEQLFNIEVDPHEVNDLSGDPEYSATLAEMRSELRERLQGLPDLSFYPESYLAANAFDAPTGFGKSHQAEISELIDIADLCLLPFAESRDKLQTHLAAEDPVERYWALITCTATGKEALGLESEIRACLSDSDLLVRTRAAECLALLKGEDPEATLKSCLAQSMAGIQTNLILNTAVLLRDSAGFEINITSKDVHPGAAEFQDVKRRLAYLEAEDGVPKNPRGTQRKNKANAKGKAKSQANATR
ncbi:MAG: sulfatase, partial [Planctomycetota bacterium]